ncbi:MAG: DNA polymerase I [Candidatus Omnitrophica bacterium]|nr:DNA polymerase I [Candidatus Omnitrophota bacterium]MDD5553015.1 DNA polymerase I [Candidatus Omnitrophota bacterium]
MSKPKLFLIDATAFCYRAFYAISGLATSYGQPTNAVYGFVNMLNKVLKDKKPELLAVCFDVSRDTFRTKKFADYKIKRPPMPDGLSSQLPIIKQIISAYGIAIFEKKGYEADDIIATLTRMAREKGMSATIISSDKDILQLVDEETTVFSPYKDEGVNYDKEKVRERFGVPAEKIIDIVALMGDEVDNIPGIKGIGEKTAAALIKEFGSVDNLLQNKEKIKAEKVRTAVMDNVETIKLNRELAELDSKIDLEFDIDKLRIGKPDNQELAKLFQNLEFRKLLKDLDVMEEDRPADAEAALLKGSDLKGLLSEDELIICGNKGDDLVICAKNDFFKVLPGLDIKAVLADHQIKKIGHNLKKIAVSLAGEDTSLGGIYFDAMVAAYLINPSRGGYELSDLALEFLGELIKPASLTGLRAAQVIKRLRPKLEKELREKSLWSLFHDIEMPLVEVLAQMEITGIRIDWEILSGLSKELEKRLIELIEDIYELSGTEFNINSPKQLRDILFDRLKLPVVKRSKTGPSTDEEVLRKLADKHKLPALLLEYRQLTKLKSAYIDSLPSLKDEKTGRIHTRFNQTVTETGRLSSSEPNLQNIPVKTDLGRNIRRAIVSLTKDSYLLSCDYSQVELRILAHISRDENMILAFKQDKDVHKFTASLICGLEEKDITGMMRESAKRVNFGIIYGLSSFGLSRDLGLSIEEAQSFIDAYFLRYPRVKDYVEEQIAFARKEGYVATILGRRRYLPEINNKNQMIRQMAERQAINTPIQGSASDLIKSAMIKIHEGIRSRGLRAKMIIQIHDELVFDCPREEIDELTELIRDRMENVMKLEVPIKVDIKKGKNWLEMESL